MPVALVYRRRRRRATHAEAPKSHVGTRSPFATDASNVDKAAHACTEMRLSRKGRYKTHHRLRMSTTLIDQVLRETIMAKPRRNTVTQIQASLAHQAALLF